MRAKKPHPLPSPGHPAAVEPAGRRLISIVDRIEVGFELV
jgi:hypothetical protein